MKIFNWVHKRFTDHKADGLRQVAEKKMSGNYVDEIGCNMNVFDGWKGGVLTIGTFGYDPLKDEQVDVSSFYDQEVPEKQQVCDQPHELTADSEEVKPLMLAAYEHDYEGLMMELVKVEGNNHRVSQKSDFDILIEKEESRERTTLAQLFSADSEKPPISKDDQIKQINTNKSRDNYKNGFSFGKNNNNNKLDAAAGRPIHKLNRMMRRMLKRKIHPDVGTAKVATKKCEITGNETGASLVSTQDAIMKLDGCKSQRSGQEY